MADDLSGDKDELSSLVGGDGVNDSDEGTIDTTRGQRRSADLPRKPQSKMSLEKAAVDAHKLASNSVDNLARKLRSGELTFCQAYFGYLKVIHAE